MNKITFRLSMVLLAIMMVFIIVACNQEQEQPAATTYTVTFESEGGSPIDPATVTVTEGAKVKKPSKEPTREGYYFGGWWNKNKQGNYSTAYNFSKAVKKDITLYARWYNTEYYMPAGWASTVTTPIIWTSKATGTVDVPAAVLQGDGKSLVTNVTPELEAALAEAIATEDYFKPAKNIIVIISDGMGVTHVQASEVWSGDLIMTKLPNVGISMTKTREDEITDSAAGGTALATGYKTTKLFASMDAEGNNLKTVSELAREQGKLVGIVTNAELEDATPADFSVHNKNRSQGWSKIAEQQVIFGADLFMGNDYSGYASFFGSKNSLYKFTEDINLCSSASSIISNFSDNKKMWAVFAGAANRFARYDTPDEDKPNLQQMTALALAWLDSHADDDKGFIVMIENTYTDYFGHGYDSLDGAPNTFNIVKEVQSTDEAVAIALKYVLEHPDTALIVTADHETGSTQLRDNWKTDFTAIASGSTSHSAQNVPVFAIGKGTEVLNSLERTETERAAGAKWDKATPYENYKIGQVVGALLGDDNFGGDIDSDVNGKSSPKFEITTTAAASSITFTLELTGFPIDEGDYIQFKIKPVSSSDKLTVSVQSADGKKTTGVIPKTVLSSTDGKELEFEDEYKYYSAVPLMKAYKQACKEKSGFADGWYQVAMKTEGSGNKLVITLESASGFPAGSKIEMDDLTVQFASTIGFLQFSCGNATAAGECLVP